jgi:hypothetical protein
MVAFAFLFNQGGDQLKKCKKSAQAGAEDTPAEQSLHN